MTSLTDQLVSSAARPKRILIVDDNEQERFLFKTLTRKHNCEIFEAESGEKAVERAIAEEFDLILLDYKMNGMDGIQALKQIQYAKRQTGSFARIAILSGTETCELLGQIQKHGCVVFVHKPNFWNQQFMDELLAIFGIE